MSGRGEYGQWDPCRYFSALLSPPPQRDHYHMIYTTALRSEALSFFSFSLSFRAPRFVRYYLLPYYVVYTFAFHFISSFFFHICGIKQSSASASNPTEREIQACVINC